VLLIEHCINTQFSKSIIETVPSYHSLAIFLKHNVDARIFIETIKEDLVITDENFTSSSRLFTIPVCYEASVAPDLTAVCLHCNLSSEELVQLHTAPIYKTYFLGFLPGFPYLGGLDPKLETPRLSKPREIVSKGSVAIGGKQTGIYPSSSPGGWNVIGCTPISLFDIDRELPSLLQPGDAVRFKAITKKQFASIARKVENGSYVVEVEVYHD
jgi:inhibitor of KinA